MSQLNRYMKISQCQFGLRSLLLLMIVSAVGFAWYRSRMPLRTADATSVIDLSSGLHSFNPQFVTFEAPRGLPSIAVPPAYTVEVAAQTPLVEHPIMAGFDDRGRLFVAENAGKNLKRDDLEKELPNSIVVLSDFDNDGVFDKRTVFADKLTFPQGALWHDGWLYVASSGDIWRFRDKDGDDVADVREQIVGKFGYTGNAADIHGCFLGPEGRIYWCEGRHGHEIADKDGTVISKGKAARIFSCNPDGSDVQTHCGGGMDNPTEIDFTAAGEMLGTVNILIPKRGDCLVHWLHGGVYPRADQPAVLAEFRRTGELLGPVHDFGHVAVSGLCRYRPFGSTVRHGLGPAFNDQWFVTEFNTHKLKQVKLTREGSTFSATVKDFLTSTDNDFHPTDVLQDADGSLLVIDTGGWFRIGCPTSQIAKPEVPGAIYRIRRKAELKIKDPRGLDIAWSRATAEELIELLADQRFAVRARAVTQIVRNKEAAVPYLATAIRDDNALRRMQATEALIKIGSEKVIAPLLDATESEDSQVRQLAAFGLGSLRAVDAVNRLSALLAADEPAEVQLAAATALGKIGDSAAVPDLLAAIPRKLDRSREHAVIYAIIEIDDPTATRPALKDANPLVRRAGLIALDQMDSSDLQREEVAALLAAGDLDLQTAALNVLSRRPGWTAELVASVSKLLDEPKLDETQQTLIVSALVAFAQQPAVQQLLAERLQDEKITPAAQRLLLEAVSQSRLQPMPAAIKSGIARALQHPDVTITLTATSAAANSPSEFAAELKSLAADEKRSAELRLAALAAVSAGETLTATEFEWLESQLAAPPALRIVAAKALGSAKLTAEQQTKLTANIATAGPLEIIPLLAAFERTGDETLGAKLAAALLTSPGSAALSLPQVEALAAFYPPATATAMKPILERLLEATREQRARLDNLSVATVGGDAASGKQIFFNRQAGCYLCHRVGNEGGRVGPDLSTIGQRRNQRDLLEAVVFPNSSLARGFESQTLLLADGRTLTGLIVRETVDALVIRGADQSEVRIARSSIEEMKPSNISIMPAGIENTMTQQQLADLIAYLQTLK